MNKLNTVSAPEVRPVIEALRPPEWDLLSGPGARDPQVKVVPPGSIQTVKVEAGTDLRLFTYGLGGCTSVLVATRDSSNSITATLTHYGNLHQEEHISELRHHSKLHLDQNREILDFSAICLARGRIEEPSKAIYLSPNAIVEVEGIRSALSLAFGDHTNFKFAILPYNSFPEMGDTTAFIVEFDHRIIANAIFQAHGEHSGPVFS